MCTPFVFNSWKDHHFHDRKMIILHCLWRETDQQKKTDQEDISRDFSFTASFVNARRFICWLSAINRFFRPFSRRFRTTEGSLICNAINFCAPLLFIYVNSFDSAGSSLWLAINLGVFGMQSWSPRFSPAQKKITQKSNASTKAILGEIYGAKNFFILYLFWWFDIP